MKITSLLVLILLMNSVYGQDCKIQLLNYFSQLDSTKRKVYRIVEVMPNFEDTLNLRISNEIKFDGIKCFPIYVWFAFVVEADGTLSNILVCPQFYDCDDDSIISMDSKIIIERFNKVFKSIKTNPGKMNNVPVAVGYLSKVHYHLQN